eukprot:744582-Pleurochrysis_carterae.AAC.1
MKLPFTHPDAAVLLHVGTPVYTQNRVRAHVQQSTSLNTFKASGREYFPHQARSAQITMPSAMNVIITL